MNAEAPATYADWHPRQQVAAAAELFTELVNNKKPTRREPRPDQHDRNAAHEIHCPRSPARSGWLANHCFGIDSDTCAYCNETPAWILADPTTRKATA